MERRSSVAESVRTGLRHSLDFGKVEKMERRSLETYFSSFHENQEVLRK
jgi:hypothetical protein